MMNQRYPLHTFVNRILMRRLALVALGVSLLIGTGTWFQMRDLVKDRAVFIALDRLAVIRAQFTILRDEGVPAVAAVEGAVSFVGAMDFDHSRGKFVYGVFFDKTDDFFVFRDESQSENVTAEQIVGSDRSQMPNFGEKFSSVVKIDGRSAVHVVVPIPDSTDQPTNYHESSESSGVCGSKPARTDDALHPGADPVEDAKSDERDQKIKPEWFYL